MNYRKTVVGVVHQDNEFLIVQKSHWNGWWDFPQGGVKNNELLEEALMREFFEELGTNKFGNITYTGITLKRLFSDETLKNYKNKKEFDGKELYYFVVPFMGDRNDITLSKELSNKKWCYECELVSSIYPPVLNSVQKILKFIRENKLY